MAATIGSSPTPNASGESNFNSLFSAYSKFGDTRSDGTLITLSNSDKWMKAAGIIPTSIKPVGKGTPKDPLSFTSTDTGIEYKKIAKVKKSIDRSEYDSFLLGLIGKNLPPDDGSAEDKKKKLLIELKEKMIKAGLPKLNSASASPRTGSAVSASPSQGGAASSRPVTGSAKADSVFARLTDHTKYTGSHKLRFDEEGKGRGKAGRN